MDKSEIESLQNGKFDYVKLLKYLHAIQDTLPDIEPEAFLNAMVEFVKIFGIIGSAIAFAFKDITDKVANIRKNLAMFPGFQGGLISFMENEEKLKIQMLTGDNPKLAPEPKYKNYDSTTRTVLRLMWFFDFITALVGNMEGDRQMKIAECSKKAYDVALGPHHPLPIRMAAKVALNFTPSRETFMKGLFPANLSEEEKYQAFKECLDTIAPIRTFLWDYYREHNLDNMP